jgi:hypothetical protein
MHVHDLDLIAALADGSLDDQSEARALIETCPECHQEYETQVTIIAALAAIEPAAMSEFEKAALHRDLWTELRSPPAKTSTPWWYRLTYAAAGLFVVVGLVAVVNQLGNSNAGEGETFLEVSSSLDEGTDGQTASPSAGEDAGYDAGESTVTTLSAESAGTTVVTADSGGGDTPDFEALADEARLQQLPPSVRTNGSTTEDLDCLNAAGLENQDVVGAVEADRKYLIAVPDGEDLDADTAVNFVDATTCEVAHVEE